MTHLLVHFISPVDQLLVLNMLSSRIWWMSNFCLFALLLVSCVAVSYSQHLSIANSHSYVRRSAAASHGDTIHSHHINSPIFKLIVKSYIDDLLADSKLVDDELIKLKLINLG